MKSRMPRGFILFLLIVTLVLSCKRTQTQQKDKTTVTDSVPSFNEKNFFRATQLIEKLGEAYPPDDPNTKGFYPSSKSVPVFYGSFYFNDDWQLVIRAKGDSLFVRKQLELALGGAKDFILEPMRSDEYTPKELKAIYEEFNKRCEELGDEHVIQNLSSSSISQESIELSLVVNTQESQREFREKVMDSPAFRFRGPETPYPNKTVGVNDTLGICLRPEYTAYSTDSEGATFLIYNQNSQELWYGMHYFITYEDENGEWMQLPSYHSFVDIAIIIPPNGVRRFSAPLLPHLHSNKPGPYRFFLYASVGNQQELLLMTEFRLSNLPEESSQVKETDPPKDFSLVGTQLDKNHVFELVEVMPEFPTGAEGLKHFIAQYIPENLPEEGRVIVQFIVEKDGSLNDIQVVRSASKELDNIAIAIVKMMPKWIPGQERGELVKVRYTIPVELRKDEQNH